MKVGMKPGGHTQFCFRLKGNSYNRRKCLENQILKVKVISISINFQEFVPTLSQIHSSNENIKMGHDILISNFMVMTIDTGRVIIMNVFNGGDLLVI